MSKLSIGIFYIEEECFGELAAQHATRPERNEDKERSDIRLRDRLRQDFSDRLQQFRRLKRLYDPAGSAGGFCFLLH